MAGIGVFGVTIGIVYPLLSLELEAQQATGTLMGLNAAMTPLGLIISAPLIPILVRRLGPLWVMSASAVATALLLTAIFMVRDPVVWFPLRFLLGATINGLFIVSETWLNAVAPSAFRGRILGIYTTILSLGFAIGPAVIAVFGSRSDLPYLIAISFCVLVLFPLLANRSRAPEMGAGGTPPFAKLARTAVLLLVIIIALSIFDMATLSLLPVYGVRAGLSEQTAALALTVLVVGNILLQLPVGILADRFGCRNTLLICTGSGFAGGLLLPVVLDVPILMWPLLFLWGGLTFGSYLVVLAILGHNLMSASLLIGNAAFAMMWGVGGILGPSVGGWTMDLFGPSGFPISLAAIWGVVFFAILLHPRSYSQLSELNTDST